LLELDTNRLCKLLLCCAIHPAPMADPFSDMNVNGVLHAIYLFCKGLWQQDTTLLDCAPQYTSSHCKRPLINGKIPFPKNTQRLHGLS
jgi:hypothetical protein